MCVYICIYIHLMQKIKHYKQVTWAKKNRFILTRIKMVALPDKSTFRAIEMV